LKSAIQTRLLVLTALLLGSFLALAGTVLERSFRASVMSGAEEQLRVLTLSLMGLVETAPGRGIELPALLPEPRLAEPGSGLYAWITDASGTVGWSSPSNAGAAAPAAAGAEAASGTQAAPGVRVPVAGRALEDDRVALAPGQFDLHSDRVEGGVLLHLRYAVIWEDLDDAVLTFHLAADRAPFEDSIAAFRQRLYLGLGAVTLIFVLAQFVAVRFALRPLRAMARQLRELEQGQRHRLGEDYPKELDPLVANLDRFVAHEEARRRRYRRAMDDLAHSLKTPLAVLGNEMANVPEQSRGVMQEQLERMHSAVARQLSRAAVGGPVVMGRSEPLRPLIERLVRALEIAQRSRFASGGGLVVDIDMPAQLGARGDERDLLEMLGNVLENAFRFARSRIQVRARRLDRLVIEIADDGPGLAPALRASAIQRGRRGDEAEAGHGIGLAAVAELAELYQGRVVLESSDLGGLCVRIELP
jgi:two-component system sensor histidine kinase PhoQ